MIVTLSPIGELYNKMCGDFHIPAHDIDEYDCRRWAMEAVHHIGGVNRFPQCITEEIHQLNQGVVVLKRIVDDLINVMYCSDEDETNRVNFSKVERSNKPLDFGDGDVFFKYAPHQAGVGTPYVPGIRFNRVDGAALIEAIELPFMDLEGEVYIPSSPTYQEAVMWYILYKMKTRDFFRDPKAKAAQFQEAKGMWMGMRNAAYGELMMCDKWELDELANVLSLGISYTGLRKARIVMPDGVSIELENRSRTGMGDSSMDAPFDPDRPLYSYDHEEQKD